MAALAPVAPEIRMNFDFERNVPGKLAARMVGAVEATIHVALIIWLVSNVATNDNTSLESSVLFKESTSVLAKALVGTYFGLALIISVLLLYSTTSSIGLATCKRLATIWCIFRAFSFLSLMGLIINNRGHFDTFCYAILACCLIAWAVSLYFVSLFLDGLDKEMAKTMPPQLRKRKVSSVSAMSGEEAGGDVENAYNGNQMEWNQFRAYLHRPSLQSSTFTISGTEDDRNGSKNNLTVPECHF